MQGKVFIPAWVDDLDSFRQWRLSEEAPQSGEIAFVDSNIWVDLTREEFLHNQIKAAFDFAIMSGVNLGRLGRYVPDQMLFTNSEAGLSAEVDALRP